MTIAYLGLGSNLGDRAAMLNAALEALDWGDSRIIARSGVYETVPMGGPPDQPDFLNMAVAVDTTLDARSLWERCAAVEAALGRERGAEERWGPRLIDIDLLVFDGAVIEDQDLIVPHPRLAGRAFVLIPLAEIAPELDVPRYGNLRELLRRIGDPSGVRKLD